VFFICDRSRATEDRVLGLSLEHCVLSVEAFFPSVDEAWEFVGKSLVIPGRWKCQRKTTVTGNVLEQREIMIPQKPEV
jgi:hypothetical protein